MSFVKSRNKILFYFFIFLLFLPFVFLNISEKHSWGDDYAQYLYQARDFLSSEKSELEILNYQDFSPKERKNNSRSSLFIPIKFFFMIFFFFLKHAFYEK